MSKGIGKKVATTVLYKDENFLPFGYCNWSRHGNIMTPLRFFYLSLCFSVPGVFLRNHLREYVPNSNSMGAFWKYFETNFKKS